MSDEQPGKGPYYDVIIIGAGISGINAAYRVQQGLPDLSYTILESRDVMGGTWSFFKYPGIRSDSEIANFAFGWAPWDQDNTIASGADIMNYLQTTAAKHGIDKHIQYGIKVTHADWQSQHQRWHLTTTGPTSTITTTSIYARFLIMGTGYYDYTTPLQTTITDLDKFTGRIIHPQFWPSSSSDDNDDDFFDHTDKHILIIGSGATTTTLVPALAKKAKHVTMLQRSPSYYLTQPTVESSDVFLRKWLPATLAYTLIRARVMIVTFLFVHFCWYMPRQSARLLRWVAKSELPKGYPLDPDFQPSYNPFEQRLCITPDGDFFQAIREGKASIVTGEVGEIVAAAAAAAAADDDDDHATTGNGVTEKAVSKERNVIKLKNSGKTITDVDVIITATGLKLHILGGIALSLDGVVKDVSTTYAWRNTCLTDIPNMCFIFGYIDNAWTLGSDSSARLFVRLIRTLVDESAKEEEQQKKKKTEGKMVKSFVARLKPGEAEILARKQVPLVNASSGYIEREKGKLPRAASVQPWKPRWHYFWDSWFAAHGNLKLGMAFEDADEIRNRREEVDMRESLRIRDL